MHIQLSTWLVAPAVLLRTATAFYPYHYGDDSTPTSPTRHTLQLASSDSDSNSKSITLPLRRVPTPLRPRQNVYNIVNSTDPTQENSVAIDQDGRDLSYMVAVTFGDSKEEYHLLLDSAASNTWVMGQGCKSEACGTHALFGAGDSSTLETLTEPFNVTYGTGTIFGTLAQDTLHLGPLSAPLTFGLATNVSQEFSLYPMDGILGIGRGSSSSTSPSTPQIMEILSSSHLIGSKLYGIHLNRAGSNDGELNLGAANPSRFTGNLSWTECLPSSKGFWEIPMTDAGVDNQPLGLEGRTAIIDTGTSFLLIPPTDAAAIHKLIPGSAQTGETFTVPCDTEAVLQLSFGQRVFNVSTEDLRGDKLDSGLCRSNIVARQAFNATQWLVGDVFLKNVYTVFDFEAGRVGMGVKLEGEGEGDEESTQQTESASSSSSSSTVSQSAIINPTATSTSRPDSQGQGTDRSSGASVSDPMSVLQVTLWAMCVFISSSFSFSRPFSIYT